MLMVLENNIYSTAGHCVEPNVPFCVCFRVYCAEKRSYVEMYEFYWK